MGLFLFGIWETPVSEYLFTYLILAVVGFGVSVLHRYLLVPALIVIGWFAVRDFTSFHRYQVGPDDFYVLQVGLAVAFSIVASFAGAMLNSRRAKIRNERLA